MGRGKNGWWLEAGGRETVETVSLRGAGGHTPLKRGVNENWRRVAPH